MHRGSLEDYSKEKGSRKKCTPFLALISAEDESIIFKLFVNLISNDYGTTKVKFKSNKYF
jgi:hypothetical protein